MVQLKIHDGPNPSAESQLTMQISDMIHACGLPFSLASHPKFRAVLQLAKQVPATYQPPTRNSIATHLLELNYDAYMEKNAKLLKKEADKYGLTVYGDGATVKRMPLVNALVSGVHMPMAILEIFNCSSHMADGKQKDASYIAQQFMPLLDQLDPDKVLIVLVFFDGASNVQKAGCIVEANKPLITSLHGAEHVASLLPGHIQILTDQRHSKDTLTCVQYILYGISSCTLRTCTEVQSVTQ
jgi:hypothetical protein